MHTSDKPLVCKKCGKSFPDRYTFRIHAKIHEGEKCFKCELCPYAAMNERFLQSHMYTHTGEKPFQCPNCVHSFRQKQLLKRHINLYHNPSYIAPAPRPRKFECTDCGKSFAHEANLKKHMNSHDDPNYNELEEVDEDMQYIQIVENVHEKDGVQLQLVTEDGQNTIYLQMEDDDSKQDVELSSNLLKRGNSANEQMQMMEEVVVHRSILSDEVQEIQATPAVEMVPHGNFKHFLKSGNVSSQSPNVQYVFIKPENTSTDDMNLVVTKEEPMEPPAKRLRTELGVKSEETTYTFAVEIEDATYTDVNI